MNAAWCRCRVCRVVAWGLLERGCWRPAEARTSSAPVEPEAMASALVLLHSRFRADAASPKPRSSQVVNVHLLSSG